MGRAGGLRALAREVALPEMRIGRRILCVLVVSPSFGAYGDFSWELSGRVGQAESGPYLDSESAGLSAAYHFDPVEDAGGPPALVTFLDPATNVSITASRDRLTLGGTSQSGTTVTAFEFESEVSDYSIGGNYLLPRSKWYAGARYSRGDVDEPLETGVSASSTDESAYGLVAGKYFAGGATRLQLSLERSKNETERPFSFCAIVVICVSGVSSTEGTTDQARVDVMHVRRFRSATYALLGGISEVSGRLEILPTVLTALPTQPVSGVVVGLTPVAGARSTGFDLGPVRAYSVGTEIYPLPQLGVRVGYTRFDGDTSQVDATEVGASWFFGRAIGLELSVAREEADELLPPTDRAALRLIGRF